MSSTSDFVYARHGSCGRDIRSNKLTCIIKIDMRWFLQSSDAAMSGSARIARAATLIWS